MRYFYFNPINKRWYFPMEFQQYPLFATFYQPYRMSAKVMWKLWQSSALIRYLFSTDHPENALPIEQIKQYVPPESILAFNLGTEGIDQKITVLGTDKKKNNSFFIKYATTKASRKNVFNEGVVLNQLTHLPFVPKLQLSVNFEDRFTLIKTTVLEGEKMRYQPIDDQILKILYCLSNQQVKSNRNYDSGLLSCFAHGDFCPWNMLTNKENIEVFDWELAGCYPLGYDLFTYIFQFEFLVNDSIQFDRLIKQNSEAINRYFDNYQIVDWSPYLLEFSKLKYKLESEKNNQDLIAYYFRLKKFAV